MIIWKLFFRNFICRKLFFRKNSIGISMIPFITRYKGNRRNPYRILEFFKKKSHRKNNFEKIMFEKIIFEQIFFVLVFFITEISKSTYP